MKLGKLCIGVRFALEKVIELIKTPKLEQAAIADDTLARLSKKDVQVPPYLLSVLQDAVRITRFCFTRESLINDERDRRNYNSGWRSGRARGSPDQEDVVEDEQRQG